MSARGILYRLGRLLGDANAVKRGLGKLTGRLARRVFG
jgi:hypothetical protein